MSHGNGMPSWEEWNHLTEDQRQYEKFKILSDLYNRDSKNSEDIEKLKNRKKLDRGLSGFFGLVGGYIATVVGKVFGI